MRGVSHATSGAAAGLLLARVYPDVLGAAVSPRSTLAFAAVCAGYALLPDLDHPNSTATRRFAWASRAACWCVRPLSKLAFRATATRRDRRRGGGAHRTLTHTAAAALGAGVGAQAAIQRWGLAAIWVVVFLGLALALKGLDELVPGPPSLVIAAGLTWAAIGVLPWEHPAAATPTPWLGVAVTVGMLVHCLGDALTEHGCPLLWPLPVDRRTWYPFRPPAWLRFRTGGPAEWLLLIALNAACLWLLAHTIPGLLPLAEQLRLTLADCAPDIGPR